MIENDEENAGKKVSTEAEPAASDSKPGEQIARPESRFSRLLRTALRWGVGLLIAFGLGMLAATWFFYRPKTQELAQTAAQREQDQQRIAELEGEITRLQSLDIRNETLQADLEEANLHIKILSALSDVNAARFALASEDVASAKASLTNTPRTLSELAGLVGPDQRDLLTAMQNRLKLAVEEMDRDGFAAQSDLGVLVANLVQLENTFFAGQE